MLSNRRNTVLKVSIVINVAVLLYATLQLTSTGAPGEDWAPTGEALGAGAGAGAGRELLRDATPLETTPRTPPPTTPRSNASTAPTLDPDKRPSVPSEPEEDELDQVDQNALSEKTLTKLRNLLLCHDRDFVPATTQRGDYWVLQNYVRAEHGPVACHEAVTYTTHAGYEYLDNVKPLVERWMAPVSIAVHAPGADLAPAVDGIRYLRDCTGDDLIRQYVTFHIFFSYKHIPSQIPDPEVFLGNQFNCSLKPPYETSANTSTYMKSHNMLYPVNVARNIARDASLTHFLLPADIELYPSPNLVPRFLNMIARNAPPLNNTNPRVFVISIFEVDAKFKAPTTKTQLKAMLANNSVIPFHKFVCKNCHAIPQGDQWVKAAETGQMDVFHVGKRRGKYVHWEPIFIGTHRDPLYDERLSWDGMKDKMTQGYVLCVKDYDFMILNNAFLCHKPGIKKFVKNAKRDLIVGRQNKYVKKIIMPELRKLYGSRAGCTL
ncbi:hypothetical protein JYU34_010993 [Plutella xylostella]|uniref:N-acetyllactosaminide beta-1,3-N-acetylglucosaminyltransferase n=1 Tax=Plutella xylostella TaxID=51655 RepID=A0ABQ7QFT2_PLUXY|nr:hypothetical protein JYU34_010993 [Plutella xylostella]